MEVLGFRGFRFKPRINSPLSLDKDDNGDPKNSGRRRGISNHGSTLLHSG